MKKQRIYLDYATTTPVDPTVAKAMQPYLTGTFGNPSSPHAFGVEANKELSDARTVVARSMDAKSHEIIFTSGGTESNNLAIRGLVAGLKCADKLHVITSVIEHSSVLQTMRALEREGVLVTYLPVNSDGIVDLAVLEKALRPKTILVSVMYVNNEIGTIQPIHKIAQLLKNSKKNISYRFCAKPFLHTDACQAPLYLTVNQDRLGADLVSLDGHKIYGPKGVGALYVRTGTPLFPIFYGGGQEVGLRSGTEPLSLIVGFSKALSLAVDRQKKDLKKISLLRDYFFSKIKKEFPDSVVNGSLSNRIANNINISIHGLNAEFAVVQLDTYGIACSAKSACLATEGESFVIRALGRNDGTERSSLRFSLGRSTTRRDIDRAISALVFVVSLQRRNK